MGGYQPAMDVPYIATIWIASALIGGLIGNRKKQVASGVIWGLLLGPLGWVVVLLLPSRGPRCSECGGVLPSSKVAKCMHCGSDVVCAPAVARKERSAIISRPGKAKRK
jgi:hypothetical protein